MKCFLVLLLLTLLFANTVLATVDIVVDTGVPIVSWCNDSDQVCIARCPSGIPSSALVLGDDYVQASMGLCFPGGSHRLVAGCSKNWFDMLVDTVYVIDPASMTVLNQRPLEATDFGLLEYNTIGEIHVVRYSSGSGGVTLVASIGDCTVDNGENFLVSADLSYPDTGQMILSDTLAVMINTGAWGPPYLQGPVHMTMTEPLSISASGGWTITYVFRGRVWSHLSEEFIPRVSAAGDMNSHLIYSQMADQPFTVTVDALGSSSAGAVGLWSDSSGVLFSSVFTDDIAPSATTPFPFPLPAPGDPAAMSQRRSDSGILLAWFQMGEIRVRHWDDEWNAFDHVAASGQPIVARGDIAVCSVSDGYWVAWLPEGSSLPVLVFVDRDMVTDIDVTDYALPQSLSLKASANPFEGSVMLSVDGDPLPDQLQVFDITGRQVRLLEREPGTGIFFWDGISSSGDVLPPGTYVIRADTGNESVSMIVVRL